MPHLLHPYKLVMGGDIAPVVQSNFALSANDFDSLSSTSTMPPGGSISRAGNAMLYAVDGGVAKLTYAPNNLLLQSQAIATSPWNPFTLGTGAAPIVTNNAGSAPDNTSTATRVQLDAGSGGTSSDRSAWRQSITGVVGTNYLASIYIKAYDASNIGKTVRFVVDNAGTSTTVTLTSSWQRVTSVGPAFSTTVSILFEARGTFTTQTADVLVWGAQLEAVTYQTSPSGTYYLNYPTPNTTSAYYGPRFDYDPVTLQPKGLLVEGTRTNVQPYSNSFNSWIAGAAQRASFNLVSTTQPDGTATGYALIEDSTAGIHQGLYGSYNRNSSSVLTYTATVYAKSSTRRLNFQVLDGSQTSGAYVTYDLAGGQVGVAAAVFGTYTNPIATMQNVGGGWYRCRLTFTSNVSASFFTYFFLDNATGTAAASTSYTGNGTSGVNVFGVQIEEGAFPTSYIPVPAASTAPTNTRSPDAFTLTGYANRLVEAYYIDEETGANYSGNSALSTGTVTISPPTFGWVTSLRAYTNAYAGSISTPSWLSFSGTTGTTAGNRTYYDSTGTLTWAPANLVKYSQDFSKNASGEWVDYWAGPSSRTANTTAVTDPLGGNTATRLVLPSYTSNLTPGVVQYNLNTTGRKVISSVWAHGASGGEIIAVSGDDINFTSYTLTTSWQRISSVVSSGASQMSIVSYLGASGASQTIYLWGAQSELATYATAPSAYIPTTSAPVYGPRYDYDPRTYFGFTATIANATPSSTFVVPTTFGDGSAASGVENYYVGQTALINGVSYPVTAYAASSRTVTITGLPAQVSQSILLGNPEWQKPRGLLIEEQRVNLCTYSQEFDGAWTRTNLVTTGTPPWVNVATAPDGTQTADKLIENTASSVAHYAQSAGVSVTSGTSYTMSAYVKAAGRSWVLLEMNGTPFAAYAWFNVSAGTVGTVGGSPSSTSITNVGNGWFRISISKAAVATTTCTLILYPATADAVSAYTGDGVSGIFVWGAQLEAGSFATSYISSITGATRAPDVAQLTGSALTTLQGATATIAAQATPVKTTSAGYLIWSTNLASSQYVTYMSLSVTRSDRRFNSDTTTTLTYSPAPSDLQPVRALFAWKANDLAAVANNGIVQTSSSGAIPNNIDAGYLGHYRDGGYLNGWIASVALYNTRLPDAILKQKSVIGSPY